MDWMLLWEGGSNHWGGGGFLFFLLAIVLTFVFLKVVFFRNSWGRRDWPDTSPDAILKRRLASGEINEADYQRLRDTLNK
jgi:uncharacterized membrane protein